MVKFQFSIYIMSCIILWYIWFISLYLYTVNITIISYCKIVYFNHIFHCNLCNEEIKKWMNEWMSINRGVVRNLGFYTVDNSCFSFRCNQYMKLGDVSHITCILILDYCCGMRSMTLGSKLWKSIMWLICNDIRNNF